MTYLGPDWARFTQKWINLGQMTLKYYLYISKICPIWCLYVSESKSKMSDWNWTEELCKALAAELPPLALQNKRKQSGHLGAPGVFG